MSDFLDSVKESLTDMQYKEGMELCKKIFEEKKLEKKVYKMTYLAPFTFRSEEDEFPVLKMGFEKRSGLVQLSEAGVQFVRTMHKFSIDEGDISQFITPDPYQSFPCENEEYIEWIEFPVLALEELGE